MHGETRTGVTLQTLHPRKFDAGDILDQTPYPGLEIPNPETYSYSDLLGLSATMTADMLVNAIRTRTFIEPRENIRQRSDQSKSYPASFAPKITRLTRRVDFQKMSVAQILRMNRAIRPLWVGMPGTDESSDNALLLDPGMFAAGPTTWDGVDPGVISSIQPGLPYVLLDCNQSIEAASAPLLVNTICGGTLVIPMLKAPGSTFRPAASVCCSLDLFVEPQQIQSKKLYKLRGPFQVPSKVGEIQIP